MWQFVCTVARLPVTRKVIAAGLVILAESLVSDRVRKRQ